MRGRRPSAVTSGRARLEEGVAARRYTLFCVALGLLIGQAPRLFHGPIEAKFDPYGLEGSVAVWGWTLARSSVGVWVGASTWPAAWWFRGPLFGALALLPLTFVSLAMANCGWP
jgi:hypothetical protein